MIPSQVTVFKENGKVKLEFMNCSTGWLDEDDYFIKRLDNINENRLEEHLIKEFEVKNTLDNAIENSSVKMLDKVLFFDENYLDALVFKSKIFKGQKHFIKALRTYRKAIRHGLVADDEYLKELQGLAVSERNALPEIKKSIFNGDHAFRHGKYENAIRFYDRALENPDKFKNKIISKLLNKKGEALVRLERFSEAIECFDLSVRISPNDFAYFRRGFCEYELGLGGRESLNRACEISKKHVLEKACILLDFGDFENALVCFELFLDNHFAEDEDYFKALNGREVCFKNFD